MSHASQIAVDFAAEVDSLSVRNTGSARKLRRRLSASLSSEQPTLVLQVAWESNRNFVQLWVAYEVIVNDRETYLQPNHEVAKQLGSGINSWHTVDAFERFLGHFEN